jgi:hypothetical protein
LLSVGKSGIVFFNRIGKNPSEMKKNPVIMGEGKFLTVGRPDSPAGARRYCFAARDEYPQSTGWISPCNDKYPSSAHIVVSAAT